MLRLVRVEVRRLFARRMVRLSLLVLLGFMLLLNGVQFAKASKNVERVQRPNSSIQVPVPAEPGDVAPPGTVVEFQELVDDPRYIMRESGPNDVKAIGGMFSFVVFLIGASFVGAEWTAGTMQALLFWEPRRHLVLLAKALALAAAAFVTSVALQALQLGFSFVTAQARGTTAGADGDFYRELFLTIGRVGLLAVFTALLAFAIAGFTRHSGAALGVGFAYFLLEMIVLRQWRPAWERHYLFSLFRGLVDKRVTIHGPPIFRQGEYHENVFVLTAGRSTLMLAIYLALALGAATLMFTQRDVT